MTNWGVLASMTESKGPHFLPVNDWLSRIGPDKLEPFAPNMKKKPATIEATDLDELT